MPATERPPSKLPNGKVNPAYTAWRKANILDKAKPSAERVGNIGVIRNLDIHAVPDDLPVAQTSPEDMESEAGSSPDPVPTTSEDESEREEALAAAFFAPIFQSAAEPEQTTIDDPREPEVAPALETPSEEPELLTLLVVKEARNDRFVLCAHPTEKGKMVPVRLHKKIGARLIRKPINVRVEGEGEEAKYFHVR